MRTVTLQHPADASGWRSHARQLLYERIPPDQVVWQTGTNTNDLFGDCGSESKSRECDAWSTIRVPRDFLTLIDYVACHSDESRFALLYRVLWRMAHGEQRLLDQCTDKDVHHLHGLQRGVSRDRHKMTAFVRFRKTLDDHYIAWFEPEHHILRLTSKFFQRRFSNMCWSICTPDESAHWNGHNLVFSESGTQDSLPIKEDMESLWRTYFSSIFNPARLRIDAMQSEMPMKYWKNLPEAPLISELIANSAQRTQGMLDQLPKQPPRYAAKAVRPAMVVPANAAIEKK